MSSPMVQATLDGRKVHTRRIIKPMNSEQKKWINEDLINEVPHGELINGGWQMHHPRAGTIFQGVYVEDDSPFGWVKCPYGKIGDILWVRETFYAYGHWTKTIHEKTEENGWKSKVEYHFHDLTISEGKNYFYEDCPPASELICKGRLGLGYFKRPSIFMPKAASRIKLEITDIRVERVQDISEEDAMAEGIQKHEGGYKTNYRQPDAKSYLDGYTWTAQESYQSLWESINGKGSWEKNPWVWVIEFKRL